MDFRNWLMKMELTEPFPTVPTAKNPYINGKWSTSGFAVMRAKVRKNPVADAEEQKRKDDDRDGYHL